MDPQYEFRGNLHRKMGELDRWTAGRAEPALEPDLEIIDAHHHAWDDHRGRYAYDELLADLRSGHNVVATVFVEAGAAYRMDGPTELQPVGEVEFAIALAKRAATDAPGTPRLCDAIIGHANLMLGDRVEDVLATLIRAGEGRLRGVRHGLTWDSGPASKFSRRQTPPHQMRDRAFRKGFARLQSLDLSFESWLFYPQLPDLIELMRDVPDANVVIDHVGGVLGLPPHNGSRRDVFNVWRGHIRALATFPGLTIKLGGLGMLYSGWDYHLRDIPPTSTELATAWRPYIETAIEAFGPDRCMFESNFPEDKQSTSYGALWNAFKRLTEGVSRRDRAALFRDTAARVYRLEG
jgi:predicted TIM-barrel fold metal-dependent hydrolase